MIRTDRTFCAVVIHNRFCRYTA